MATWTGITKHNTTSYPEPKKGEGMPWKDAIMRWIDANFTWQEVGSTSWTGGTMHEATWTGETKN